MCTWETEDFHIKAGWQRWLDGTIQLTTKQFSNDMSGFIENARGAVDGADRSALKHEEEAVEVASQWAQEKLENFLLEVEWVLPLARVDGLLRCTNSVTRNSNNDHKLLKISYIISRRTSIDVFSSKGNDLGDFVKDIITSISGSNVMNSIGALAGTVIKKLFGSASGSAQTERF
jgi:hypothetical protein